MRMVEFISLYKSKSFAAGSSYFFGLKSDLQTKSQLKKKKKKLNEKMLFTFYLKIFSWISAHSGRVAFPKHGPQRVQNCAYRARAAQYESSTPTDSISRSAWRVQQLPAWTGWASVACVPA